MVQGTVSTFAQTCCGTATSLFWRGTALCGAAVLQCARTSARPRRVRAPLRHAGAAGRHHRRHRAAQLPASRGPDRHAVSSDPRGGRRAVSANRACRRRDHRSRAVLSRRDQAPPWLLLRPLLRLPVPFLGLAKWRNSMVKPYWLFHNYRVSAAVLRRERRLKLGNVALAAVGQQRVERVGIVGAAQFLADRVVAQQPRDAGQRRRCSAPASAGASSAKTRSTGRSSKASKGIGRSSRAKTPYNRSSSASLPCGMADPLPRPVLASRSRSASTS